MNIKEFEEEAEKVVAWMSYYFKNIEEFPVKSQVKPGEIKAKIPTSPPQQSEEFDIIMNDFEKKILPGITHWHSPGFFAYFPGNKSKPSILAEMLTTALGAQCMSWITSPAATELEERMMEWLCDMIGLPEDFTGVIQDTASTATLCAILTAREKASDFKINEQGFYGQKRLIVYSSQEVHSSIDKAVRIAGIGSDNLRKIAVDKDFAMVPTALEDAIRQDIASGYQPLCIISAFGTTSSTAIDPIAAISAIAEKYGIWHHVDAAYAGTALICPEYRMLAAGAEKADSFVFNPHKWMFTNFDCTAYFVRDPKALINTFSMTPEYLRTEEDNVVNNYRDWGIQLGRRFRALKLWFVIRNFGVEGMRKKLRGHMKMATWLKKQIEASEDFVLMAPVPLNLVCFRYSPDKPLSKEELNATNEQLMHILNDGGKLFMTHTKLSGYFTLRMVIGNTDVNEQHVWNAWDLIQKTARSLNISTIAN